MKCLYKLIKTRDEHPLTFHGIGMSHEARLTSHKLFISVVSK